MRRRWHLMDWRDALTCTALAVAILFWIAANRVDVKRWLEIEFLGVRK